MQNTAQSLESTVEQLCSINEKLSDLVRSKTEEIAQLKALIEELSQDSDEAKKRYIIHSLTHSLTAS